MFCRMPLVLIAGWLLLPCVANAYEMGDVVVVLKNGLIHVDKAEPEKVWPGMVLKVEALRDKWLWVASARAGWLDQVEVIKLADAVGHFSQRITQNPKDAEALLARGMVQHYQGAFPKALADYNAALTISPSPSGFAARGLTYYAQKEFDKALIDYDYAIRENPKDVPTLNNRANVWIDKGDYAKALADFETAIAALPDDQLTNNNLGWLKATCPDEKFRDGAKAIEMANKACEAGRWRDAQGLDTLGAAQAEAGDFEKAIASVKRAMELATKQELPPLEKRLKLYEAKQPFREEGKVAKKAE